MQMVVQAAQVNIEFAGTHVRVARDRHHQSIQKGTQRANFAAGSDFCDHPLEKGFKVRWCRVGTLACKFSPWRGSFGGGVARRSPRGQ